jgi:hypothetical protein
MTALARAAATLAVLTLAACAERPSAPAQASEWNPRAWTDEDTVELGVVRADGSPRWFKVWIVVLDDQPYVRLGSASVSKIEENRTKPFVGVRVAGREFPHVKLDAAPDRADAVAQAMAHKYSSDVLIRLFPHPMTARLTAE